MLVAVGDGVWLAVGVAAWPMVSLARAVLVGGGGGGVEAVGGEGAQASPISKTARLMRQTLRILMKAR
jgi:hypothetical protein